jgi:hypothetical protein
VILFLDFDGVLHPKGKITSSMHLIERYADDWAWGDFVTELPETFFDVPVLWVHGHTHQPFDYRVRSCRIVCNPRGYVN